MGKILTFFLIALSFLLMSCEPCPYHNHDLLEEPVEYADLSVQIIDSTGGLLRFRNASYNSEGNELVLDVTYDFDDSSSVFLLHVDGDEINGDSEGMSYNTEAKEGGKSFTIKGLPLGRHVIQLSVIDSSVSSGSGSLQIEVEIPYSIGIGG